jgi:hypothetical protein
LLWRTEEEQEAVKRVDERVAMVFVERQVAGMMEQVVWTSWQLGDQSHPVHLTH